MNNELPSQTVTRARGKGFPVLPLGQAVEIVKNAGKYGKEHHRTAFASYMGHDTTNSGAFKSKLAAMKDWALVRVDGDRVVLTELANRIAHPSSSEDEVINVRKAFLQEELFAKVRLDSARGVDLSLEFIGNRAVNDWGVAPRSKDQFARSFAESIQAAGLGQMAANGAIQLFADEPDEDAADESRESVAHETVPSAAQPSRSEAPGVAAPPTLHQHWRVSGGTLVFEARLDHPLPANAFREVAAVVEAVESLVASLGDPAADNEGA